MVLGRWMLAGVLATVAMFGATSTPAHAFFYKFEVAQMIETSNADGSVTTFTLWDNNEATVTFQNGKEKAALMSPTQRRLINGQFKAAKFHDMEGSVFTAATPSPTGTRTRLVWYDESDFWSWYFGGELTTETGANAPASVSRIQQTMTYWKNYALANGAVVDALQFRASVSMTSKKVSMTTYVWNRKTTPLTLTWTKYPMYEWEVFDANRKVEWVWSKSGVTIFSGKPRDLVLNPNSYARWTMTWNNPSPGPHYSDTYLLSKPAGHSRTAFNVPRPTN